MEDNFEFTVFVPIILPLGRQLQRHSNDVNYETNDFEFTVWVPIVDFEYTAIVDSQ